MQSIKYHIEQVHIAKQLFRWIMLILPVAISVGALVALFLWLLEWATITRWNNMWLILILPLSGVLIYALYKYFGQTAEAGNNLIMDEIHKPGGGIPFQMAPLVLITTVITHLFGGSAGREGTAVQMGGSIAAFFANLFKLKQEDKRILLMGGMAAGFGAVFGTPITGAIFALEVIAIGRIKYDALIPCLIASIIANITCNSFPIHHTHYAINFSEQASNFLSQYISFDILLLVKVVFASILFGLASFMFSKLSHFIKNQSGKHITKKWIIPVVGGILVIGISYALGTFDYLGLGVHSQNPDSVSILSSFNEGGATYFSWFWKLLLTAITLSMGFKGGEVTPLFFIGATLGNTIGVITGAPIDLMAGLGFIAVFAGATNTPLACTMMGVELFGSEYVIYYAVATFVAYYFSGNSGIYKSQRVAVAKYELPHLARK